MRKVFVSCGVVALLGSVLWAQSSQTQTTTTTTTTTKPATTKKATAARKGTRPRNSDLQTLREGLAAQQQQIQQLRDELQRRDTAVQQLQQQVSTLQSAASQAQSTAQAAAGTSQQNAQALTAVNTTIADLKTNQTSAASSFQEEQKRLGNLEHPRALHFKGVTITPGGFIEAAGVYRTRNENASVNSASGDFNIPFGGTPNGSLSEFRFDARQSRLTLLGEGKIGAVKALGYYEVDFLGAAPTANENQSNSFNLRQRQLWASAQFENDLTFTGGQQWSLFTLNRKGMNNRGEFLPMTINAQYVIGYDWARQPGLRVMKGFSNKAWLGFAVENSSTVNPSVVGTVAGGAPVFGFANSANAQSPNGNFTLSNTPGANGVSTNAAPDLVAKITFEPGWGHYELKGVGRFFRDRARGNTDTVFGGGFGVGAILPLVQSKLDFIAEGSAGSGMGRYGSGGGVDVTLRPDASIAALKSYHLLTGPEIHVGKNLDLYLYGGAEYYQRYYVLTGATTSVGYGSPFNDNRACTVEQTTSAAITTACNNHTRFAYEITPGFWYRFYKGSAGTVQWGGQYSYSSRTLWPGNITTTAKGFAPKGVENQVYTSFRYYLP